ncbi:hypothetical protein Lal_00025853 [Lupinus albus]|nr:hypothetical protein Lal_00025853 [Lupinus albus]
MVAEVKIWNPIEVAEEARKDYASQILASHLTIDPSLSFPLMKPLIIKLCKDIFKAWSNLDDSCFHVEKISGGITNLLLKVSVKEENCIDDTIAIRLYGPNTEYIIDRHRELQAVKYLSAAGFGAKWLGIFGNGMVQSFINAHTLIPSDIRDPKLAAKVAKELRRFHHVDIPGSKEPQLWNDIWKFFEKASVLEFEESKMHKTYKTISFREVHDEIVELKYWAILRTRWSLRRFSYYHRTTLRVNIDLLLVYIGLGYVSWANHTRHDKDVNHRIQTGWMKRRNVSGGICDKRLSSILPQGLSDRLNSPVIFSHNDLLSANIMINDEDKIYFIDYEYASYNYRGFDIANHFAEYAGFECDYNLYPNMNEQFHFFRHYIQPDRPHEKEFIKAEVSEKDLETFYVETNTYVLASHLFWALWGLIQAKMSAIDFDYLGYFFLRYNEYKRQKEKCFLQAQSYLSGFKTE